MSDYRLYVDKYIPNSFNDIQFNQEAAKKLLACSKAINIPHMIIKGSEGSGRKTMTALYLKSKYNLENLHVKYQIVEIKNASKKIELQMLYSDYHYQIDPSTHGVYDRIIVQSFIKDILQTKPICNVPYHTVIITNADHLTFEAQQSLRRTLEKNVNNSRFIFIVSRESTLIDSLVSRCIQIRLSAPSDSQISTILENICTKEIIMIGKNQLDQIVSMSKRNLSKAMNLLQYIHLNSSSISHMDFNEINATDKCLTDLTNDLINAKNPQSIISLRTGLYDLLVQCVDPLKILKDIFYLVFNHLEKIKSDDKQKIKLIQILSKCENTLRQGSKPIYHLECMCVSIIILLNGLSVDQ